uniref:Retrotransposon gag domain-containing protein n=1 Tax=Cannabis sativa TaxID=3483 RepID=A0A803NVI1_CANSA
MVMAWIRNQFLLKLQLVYCSKTRLLTCGMDFTIASTSLSNLKQGDSNITSYFAHLKVIWDELREFQSFTRCTCSCTCGAMKKIQDCYNRDQILQFLMGLNESYAQEERQRVLGFNPIIVAASKPSSPCSKKARLTCFNCHKPGH